MYLITYLLIFCWPHFGFPVTYVSSIYPRVTVRTGEQGKGNARIGVHSQVKTKVLLLFKKIIQDVLSYKVGVKGVVYHLCPAKLYEKGENIHVSRKEEPKHWEVCKLTLFLIFPLLLTHNVAAVWLKTCFTLLQQAAVLRKPRVGFYLDPHFLPTLITVDLLNNTETRRKVLKKARRMILGGPRKRKERRKKEKKI